MNDQELAKLIAALEFLKEPFDRKQISKLPRTEKRPELDYVNHAHVTNRLNQYAPGWSYTLDEVFTQSGEYWVRGTMTIYGASRVEFGKGKDPLEATSHFIRRAAMRFGVATALWAKEDFEDNDASSAARPSRGAADAPGGPSKEITPTGGPNVEVAPEALGEGANGAASTPLATEAQWRNLLQRTSGKTAEAAKLINDKNGTDYTYRSAREGATWAELEKALA